MTEAEQIKTIISAARTAPKKVGVVVDDKGKEERFLKAFREALKPSEFNIEAVNLSKDGKIRTIFITRIAAQEIGRN